MDIVRLPKVAHSTSLQHCMVKMGQSRRSGLVSFDGDVSRVISAAEIVGGIASGKERLDQLEGVRIVELFRPLVHSRTRFRTPLGQRHRRYYGTRGRTRPIEMQLKKFGAQFGLIEVQADSALVASVARQLARLYAAPPKECYCTGPKHHGWSNMQTGDSCPLDSYPVVCSR